MLRGLVRLFRGPVGAQRRYGEEANLWDMVYAIFKNPMVWGEVEQISMVTGEWNEYNSWYHNSPIRIDR